MNVYINVRLIRFIICNRIEGWSFYFSFFQPRFFFRLLFSLLSQCLHFISGWSQWYNFKDQLISPEMKINVKHKHDHENTCLIK